MEYKTAKTKDDTIIGFISGSNGRGPRSESSIDPLKSTTSGRSDTFLACYCAEVENFTRVETFGNPDVHWVRATIDDQDRNVFSFRQQIVEKNIIHSELRPK